jgi:hypothetical protein
VFLIGIVLALGYYPIVDKDTVSWIRSVGNGFTYALLLALKIRAGVTSDTQTTNTNTVVAASGNVSKESIDKLVGKEGE